MNRLSSAATDRARPAVRIATVGALLFAVAFAGPPC